MSEEEYIDDLDYIAVIVKQNKKLIKENIQLKGKVEILENTLKEILHFCNHLHNDCKYNLNDGYIRKIRNICKRELDEKQNTKVKGEI